MAIPAETTTIATKNQASRQAERGMRTTLVGIAANLVLAVSKGAAGVLGHSYALTADAIESGTDVFSSLLVYIGLKVAARPADENHPQGDGKAEALAAVAVSLFLFAAAFNIGGSRFTRFRCRTPCPAGTSLRCSSFAPP
jgi:cation diffusion facilitator family transporter